MNTQKRQANTLLERDIKERFAEEKKLVTNETPQKQNGKTTMIMISVALALVVLSGLIYPLFQ